MIESCNNVEKEKTDVLKNKVCNSGKRVIVCGSDNNKSFDVLRLIADRTKVLCYLVDEQQSDIVTTFCKQYGIPICNCIQEADYQQVDLLISFSYKRLLDINLIRKAKVAINFHPAPLPFYRGRATTVQALVKGEKKWGVTCHYLADRFDTGKIIERRWFDITDDLQNGQKLSEYSWGVCLKMVEDMLDRLLSGDIPEGYQQEEGGNYYSMKQLAELKRISLEEDVDVIDRKINAIWFPPYEGAYIELSGKKFYLINEKIMNEINQLYNQK